MELQDDHKTGNKLVRTEVLCTVIHKGKCEGEGERQMPMRMRKIIQYNKSSLFEVL